MEKEHCILTCGEELSASNRNNGSMDLDRSRQVLLECKFRNIVTFNYVECRRKQKQTDGIQQMTLMTLKISSPVISPRVEHCLKKGSVRRVSSVRVQDFKGAIIRPWWVVGKAGKAGICSGVWRMSYPRGELR